MPGATDNIDLLAGINQLILSLNELAGVAGTDVTVQSASPDVTVQPCNPNVYLSCGAGAGTGTELEQTPGTEGGTPPSGAGPVDPAIDERKCKAANMIVSDLITYTQTLDENNLFNPAVDFSSLGAFLGSLSNYLGILLTEASMTIGGFLTDLAIFLFNSSIDAPSLTSKLDTNRTDLVCALYNATDADNALNDFLAVTALTAGEDAYIRLLFRNNVLNVLFFSVGDSETMLAGYTGSVDCASCGGGSGCVITMEAGSLAPGGEVSAEWWASSYYLVSFHFGAEITDCYRTLSSIVLVSGVFSGWHPASWGGPVAVQDHAGWAELASLAAVAGQCGCRVQLVSDQPFTVQVNQGSEC